MRHSQPYAQGMRSILLEAPHGLEDLAVKEVSEKLGLARQQIQVQSGSLSFGWRGNLSSLRSLKAAEAGYLQLTFDVPRPKALLGDQNFRRLVAAAREIVGCADARPYQSIFISAAGRQSSVLKRLHLALAAELDLTPSNEVGDLLIRLRRPPDGSQGWQALIRIGQRPQSTRDWRVCNYEGALNGAVAYGMVRLSTPQSGDIFLNIGCGSGTLMVERLAERPASAVIGLDFDPAALACASKNIRAADLKGICQLIMADGARLPISSSSVDVVAADLPFGNLVGTHTANLRYYPALLSEVHRVIRPAGRAVLITNEIKLTDSLLKRAGKWSVLSKREISLRGLHPRIYVLQPKSGPPR